MEETVIDTDIFSEILKGKNRNVAVNANSYLSEHPSFTITAITALEIVKGFHKLGLQERIAHFIGILETVDILPLDAECAVVAGKIYADLESSGQTIGRADPMIAGIAVAKNLILVTGNTAHYTRIQDLGYGLRISDWRDFS